MATFWDAEAALYALATLQATALLAWGVSLWRRDVSVVDSLWSLFILGAALTYAALAETGPRAPWLLPLAALWALRLAGHITWRNHGQPEDPRYQAIRARNQPHFALKSLYLVFGLQAGLAWVVAQPLMVAAASPQPPNLLDALGVAHALFGIAFEAVADAQLARFKARPEHRGRVLDSGLWRYSRHPNYFGECCVWWGFGLVALAAGGGWALLSPLLMTLLLLKVSGVALMEQDIGQRRPDYADYIARTNAFIPGPPRPTRRSPQQA